MTENDTKPTILWILQDNQVSPIIVDFLKLLKEGIGKINVQVLVPARDTKIHDIVKPLNPAMFEASRTMHPSAVENFERKRDQISEVKFTHGLEAWKALVMDDMGAGILADASLHLPHLTRVVGIILQIPTPLGSAAQEEIIFYEWVRLAQDNNIFVAGYELLPLYTRWTMLPAMLDGVITTNKLSYNYLSHPDRNIKGKVWRLPAHEGKVFSPGIGSLWHNGLEAPYRIRMEHNIPKEKTIIYITHNVATSYEYRRLLEEISSSGEHIHLMFSYGKDQTRGTHSHKQVISTISGKTLDKFYSHSFHDLSRPWEMVMADAVLSVSHCYSTMVAATNGIPSIIMDPTVPQTVEGNLTFVSTHEQLKEKIKAIVENHAGITDITNIIYQIATGTYPKLKNTAEDTTI